MTESHMIESNGNIELLNNYNNELPNSLIRKGVKLLKCERERKKSNECFKNNIHHNNNINDINQEIDKILRRSWKECSKTVKNPYETNSIVSSKNELKTLKLKLAAPQHDSNIKGITWIKIYITKYCITKTFGDTVKLF